MAASPVFLNLPPVSVASAQKRPSPQSAWIPVWCSLVFVCFTSTSFMGGSHTQVLVSDVWKALLGNWHYDLTGVVNGDGRKVGHFFGYGTIGLLFRRAWHASMRAWALAMKSKLALFSASLGIASTFAVASLDEWHQRYLPGRVGSFHDVLLDTCGALCLNVLLFAWRAHKREKAQNAALA